MARAASPAIRHRPARNGRRHGASPRAAAAFAGAATSRDFCVSGDVVSVVRRSRLGLPAHDDSLCAPCGCWPEVSTAMVIGSEMRGLTHAARRDGRVSLRLGTADAGRRSPRDPRPGYQDHLWRRLVGIFRLSAAGRQPATCSSTSIRSGRPGDRRGRHRQLHAAVRLARWRLRAAIPMVPPRRTIRQRSGQRSPAARAIDWYYASDADRRAGIRTPISDGLGGSHGYAATRISEPGGRTPHHDRVGGVEIAAPTAWVPESKPVWFTELGCPAIDMGASQPNVFPDPKSSASALPWYSTGARSDIVQNRFLSGALPLLGSGERRARSESQSGFAGLRRAHDRSRHDFSLGLGRASVSAIPHEYRCLVRRRQLDDRALAQRSVSADVRSTNCCWQLR